MGIDHPSILESMGILAGKRDVTGATVVREGGFQPASDPGPVPASLIRRSPGEEVVAAPSWPDEAWQALSEALTHEARREILVALSERDDASANELAQLLQEGLSQISYHVKFLADKDIIQLTRTLPRSGAVEHYYRLHSTLRPIVRKATVSRGTAR
jgi:DNA-binding transcriptional ArsR family regulator